jgi:hypothetical protein
MKKLKITAYSGADSNGTGTYLLAMVMKIANENDFQEQPVPTLQFSTGTGTNDNLGLAIRKAPEFDDKWVLEVSKRQDYESTFKRYIWCWH